MYRHTAGSKLSIKVNKHVKRFSKNSQLLEPLLPHIKQPKYCRESAIYVLRTRDEGTEAHLHVENSTFYKQP